MLNHQFLTFAAPHPLTTFQAASHIHVSEFCDAAVRLSSSTPIISHRRATQILFR